MTNITNEQHELPGDVKWYYITLLDFTTGDVFHYKITEDQVMLTDTDGVRHALDQIHRQNHRYEFMLHEQPHPTYTEILQL